MIISDAVSESEAALLERLANLRVERMRLLTAATDQLRSGCFALGVEIDTEPVSPSGRQRAAPMAGRAAISRTTHRHGRVAP